MHILLFGGSFNPPHLGHLIVIEQAFELIQNLDELWLLPTFNHSFGKGLAPAQDRLNMCDLLLSELSPSLSPRVKLCRIEVDYGTSGSTYETLKLLNREQQYLINHRLIAQSSSRPQFSFLMGSDQLPAFTKWQHWQELLEEMPFYVYPRGGHRHDVTFPNMTLLESPTQIVTNISSTLVRNRLQQQLPVNRIVTNKVHRYPLDHHLYRHVQ